MLSTPYEPLSRFASNLATCLESGVDMEKSLENASRSLARTPLASSMQVALTRVSKGASLTEALAAAEWGLPKFFLPMIQAGEQTGRVDESLRYLERHCKLLIKPSQAIRNVWLIPLALILFSTFAQLAVLLFAAPLTTTLGFVFSSLLFYAKLGLFVFIVCSSPAKTLFDQLKLHIPFLSDVVREAGVNHFFHAMAMLYAAAGRRVDGMISVAAKTVINDTIRKDFLNVAERIKQGAAVSEAFAAAKHVSQPEKDIIESGDISGTLERSFENISREAGEKLQFRLGLFQKIVMPILYFGVVYSLVFTLMSVVQTTLMGAS